MSKKIHISIDNNKIECQENDNLLQVALDNGIEIPNLCYHKKITPTGACRLCLVKIEGSNGLITSCSTEAKEGMKVIAFDDELESYRLQLLDYLLAEHNFEYDGSYNDEFRNLIYKYKLDKKENRKVDSLLSELKMPIDNSSRVLSYQADKCIKCLRCIKACTEVQGKSVLSMTERGISTYVVAGDGVWDDSECDGCGECVQLCPTGALVEKPHRSFIQMDKIDRKVKTTCPYCGVGCQMDMWIQDEKIVRVTGYEGISPNYGRMCVKGRFGYNFIQKDDRLKTPLIKRNGVFEEASWDEALDLVASKFSEIKLKHGGKAFAGYASAKCSNEDNYIFQRLMRDVIGTNNIDNCARLCHASTVAAMMKSLGGGAGTNSIEDYENADCVYVTGNNIIETHPVTATFIKKAQSKGAKIIVVDPKHTAMVRYSDVWLQPKIGTDVALINGLIHILIRENLVDENFISDKVEESWISFERLKALCEKYPPEVVEEITTVPKEKLILAARLFGNADKTLIATGMGMSQEVTGTNNVLSLLNMCLITGKLGKVGSGINPPRGQNNVQGVSDVGAMFNTFPGYIPVTDEKQRIILAELWETESELIPNKPGLSAVEIMKAAYDEEIKAMYIMGENPLVSDPNLNHVEAGIKKLDFLVVQDIFMNDTTPYADVILPAASFAEKDGTFTNSDRRVNRIRKAVNSPGKARVDWEIIWEIAKRMGKKFPDYNSPSDIFDELAKAMPIYAGISWDRIEHQGVQWPCPDKDHPGSSTLFLDKFNTASGKGIIHPIDYVEQSERASIEFPFILNTGRILYHYHTSTMTGRSEELVHFAGDHYVMINSNDASKLAILNNDKVRIKSKRGFVETTAVISNEVASGEVFMPWHYNEARVNLLTRDELDPTSKIPPYKLSAVSIEKIS